MVKFWKPFRVVLSLLVLMAIAFIFIDFRQQLPSSWYNGFTFFQFVPSLRKFLIAAGFISAGFIAVTLITLLVGRVYCSLLCPLGILQDIISFFSKKFSRKKVFRYKYAKPKNKIRYLFLVLAVVPLFFGSIVVLGLLDPYSNFGRMFSDFGRPVYLFFNNTIADLLIHMKIYSLAPQDLPPVHWMPAIYTLLVLVLVVWLAAKWGRLYCNSVCPVGTFLGILSRWSLFKIKIDRQSCTKCGQCAFVCKSQCISIKEQEVDFSRCVGCFNCLKSCDQESITYKFSLAPVKKTNAPFQSEEPDQSKRKLIAGAVVLTGALLGGAGKVKAGDEKELKYRDNLTPVKKTHPCSPPGSGSIDHFNDACTACHLCVSACPNGVLQPSLFEYGLAGLLQPFMDPSGGYCNFECTKCGEVCPTGAILPLTVEEKKVTQVGEVKFIKTNCVVYTDETVCGACSEHCPTKAVKMVPYKERLNIPEVDTEICVGCGACEHACPVRPHRAIYVDGNAVHKVAKKPEVKKAKDEEIEEFPF